jgi:hypothetical protein
VLRAASQLGMRVRATGVGHSRSPLYVDEGNVLMDVRNLQRHDGPRMEYHPPVSVACVCVGGGVGGIAVRKGG